MLTSCYTIKRKVCSYDEIDCRNIDQIGMKYFIRPKITVIDLSKKFLLHFLSFFYLKNRRTRTRRKISKYVCANIRCHVAFISHIHVSMNVYRPVLVVLRLELILVCMDSFPLIYLLTITVQKRKTMKESICVKERTYNWIFGFLFT